MRVSAHEGSLRQEVTVFIVSNEGRSASNVQFKLHLLKLAS